MKLLFVLFATAAPAWSEVMDKEPTLSEIWWSSALSAGLAWLLGRCFPWVGWLALFLAFAIGLSSRLRRTELPLAVEGIRGR